MNMLLLSILEILDYISLLKCAVPCLEAYKTVQPAAFRGNDVSSRFPGRPHRKEISQLFALSFFLAKSNGKKVPGEVAWHIRQS
jgi:hypothetical protein